jgi:anti-anti-sigma factor
MPDRINHRQAKVFLHEVQPFLVCDRPQLVFDLSQVRQLDAAGVDMLLHCMSEVMKRDGDLKLAAVSPQASTVLELTRTDRLFEIYDTSTNAVRSFTYFLPNALRPSSSLIFPPALPIDAPTEDATPDGGSLAA